VDCINELQKIMAGFDFSYLISILMRLIPTFLCITVHELCHGLVAYRLGDTTAKAKGRLTLNPIKHIDPMGFLMMLVFRMGWAKPVPVNMRNFKNPKRGMALTALAGPASNVLLSLLFMFLYGLAFIPLANSRFGQYVLEMLQITSYLSISLAIFNLLPVPPLDGSKVVLSFLPDGAYIKLMRYERYGMIIMLVLVATGLLSRPLSSAINYVYSAFWPVGQFGADIVYFLFYK